MRREHVTHGGGAITHGLDSPARPLPSSAARKIPRASASDRKRRERYPALVARATAWEIRRWRVCERCGGEIEWRKRLDARTCSDACRQALHRHGNSVTATQTSRPVHMARRVLGGSGEQRRDASAPPPGGRP